MQMRTLIYIYKYIPIYTHTLYIHTLYTPYREKVSRALFIGFVQGDVGTGVGSNLVGR